MIATFWIVSAIGSWNWKTENSGSIAANYAYYLEKKAARVESEQTTASRAGKLLKRELEWLRRAPKARGTKAKARVNSVHELAHKAKSRSSDQNIQLDVKTERLGSKVIELHKVKKGYDDRILINGLDYKFKRSEKVGIVGRNGSGKSTLLRMITGETEPDAGKVVVGETVKIGYYRQEGLQLKQEMRVIDVVRKHCRLFAVPRRKKTLCFAIGSSVFFSTTTASTHMYTS